MVKEKVLQVPVIVGEGSGQFFVEKEIKISPPSPPVFMVKEIKKWIDVYNTKVIPGKVIFNAWIWKDINYKTVEDVHDETVNGPVFHATTKIPVAGFVEIKPINYEEVKEGDIAEVLEAFVEGEKDHWEGERRIKGVTVFTRVHEKMVVKLKFKVVRIQHVKVDAKEEEKETEVKDIKDYMVDKYGIIIKPGDGLSE